MDLRFKSGKSNSRNHARNHHIVLQKQGDHFDNLKKSSQTIQNIKREVYKAEAGYFPKAYVKALAP